MSEEIDRIQILIDEKEAMISEYIKRKLPIVVLEDAIDELYCDLALAEYDHSISDSEKEKRDLEKKNSFSEEMDKLVLNLFRGE